MASRMWKDGTRRGIAYVEGRAAAEQVLTITGRRRAPVEVPARPRRRTAAAPPVPAVEQALEGAMAVYSDRRGKPFAWQIPFDIRQWDQVTAVVTPPADAKAD